MFDTRLPHTDGSVIFARLHQCALHLPHAFLDPPPSPGPKSISIGSPFLYSSRQGVHVLYNGPLLFPLKIALYLGIWTSIQYMAPWAYLIPLAKQHLDRFRHFCGVTIVTHRPWYSVCSNRPHRVLQCSLINNNFLNWWLDVCRSTQSEKSVHITVKTCAQFPIFANHFTDPSSAVSCVCVPDDNLWTRWPGDLWPRYLACRLILMTPSRSNSKVDVNGHRKKLCLSGWCTWPELRVFYTVFRKKHPLITSSRIKQFT